MGAFARRLQRSVAIDRPWLGCYMGGTAADDDIQALFGIYPAMSTSYYQANTPGLKIDQEKARIDKGMRPLLNWTTKGTDYLQDIANGSGAGYDALVTYVSALATLSTYAQEQGLKVYATIDQEPDVRMTQGIFPSYVTPALYAKCLSTFVSLCRVTAPKVVTLYWYGGSQTSLIDQIGSALNPLPDMYTLDPYSGPSHASTETFEQLVGPKLTWLRGRSWYNGKPVGLSEFGARHSDADMEQFYSNLHEHCARLGLLFAVFWNRTDTNVITLTQADYPLSVAAFSASLHGA